MEEAIHPSARVRERNVRTPKSATLQRVVAERIPDSGSRLFVVRSDQLLGDDGEGTVDGIRPTDLDHVRMADVLAPFIGRVLAGAVGPG